MTRIPARVRPLTIWDAAFAWRVAAEPSVRAVSFDHEPPTIRKHVGWMWRNLSGNHGCDEGVVILCGGARCGIGTLRKRGREWWIGVAVLPLWRGQGIATDAIIRMTSACIRRTGKPVYAAIQFGNIASVNLFHRCGYEDDDMIEDDEGGHWVLRHPTP